MTSASPALSFEQPIELSDVRRATWFIWRRTRLKSAVVIYVLACLLGAWIGSRIPGALPFGPELLIVAVIGGITWALLMWFLIERTSKRAAARAQKEGPVAWAIGDDGITLGSVYGEVKLKWSLIRGFILDKGLVFLSLASGRLIFIPLHPLSAQQQSDVLQILGDKNVRRLA